MARQTHYRACHLCEAICGIAVEVEDSRIVSVRGDAEDPFSRGHVCPKAVALIDVHEDPDRLRRPLRREGSSWREVSWRDALAEAAERLASIQHTYGRNAVAVYQGNPTVHNYGSILFMQPLLQALGTRNRFSATSVDQLPHMLASLLMFGHQLLLPVPDVDRTDFLLMLGANPVVSNGSLMTAPGIERRLKALRQRGGQLVVVDPRRTETAALADTHLAIRPGTDALLLLALLNVLFEEGRVSLDRLAAFTSGVESVARIARDFPPDAVAPATGLDADRVRSLARAFAAARTAVAYGRVGVSTQEFGGLCAWLVNVLNVVTGNLDRAGGAMFTRPAADLVAFAARIGQRGHFDKSRSRVSGLPEFGGEWPASVLAEEIETPGDGQIKALVTSAGNPVLSTPNGVRLERALAGLEFMVAIDIYRNETTRHAHLILPPTFGLEQDHYDLVFHTLAVHNTARYSAPVFAKAEGTRYDWQILADLASGIARAKRLPLRSRASFWALRRLGPRGLLAHLLRTGAYGAGWRPFGGGMTLSKLRRSPHGIDLGPLQPCLPARLYTRDKHIDLAPQRFLDDVPRLRALLNGTATDGLRLIGRRELRSNNSWMHNARRLVKGPVRCTLLMHPTDAAERGLTAGQDVEVGSRVGHANVPLEVTVAVRPGVVCLPHGWGHDRPGVQLQVAAERPGASLNDVTDDARVDRLSGTAALNGVPVEVRAAGVGAAVASE